MGKFVKRQELKGAGTPLKISKVSVLETVNHVAASQIDIVFAAAATLSRAQKERKVSQLQGLEFRKQSAIMLAIIVSKIKKNPLQYNFARKFESLDPRIMVSKPESAVKIFQQVLNRLIEEKWKTNEQADAELIQYRKVISSQEVLPQQICFIQFCPEKTGQVSKWAAWQPKGVWRSVGYFLHCLIDSLQ